MISNCRKLKLWLQIPLLMLCCQANVSYAMKDAWVTADSLNVRACAATSCKRVGKLEFLEKVTVYKTDQAWSRISKLGKPAAWLATEFIQATPPQDPRYLDTPTYHLIKASDDYLKHHAVFITLTKQLMQTDWCVANDFIATGGWLKSSLYPGQPIYLTYCGGIEATDRIYLNAELGKVRR